MRRRNIFTIRADIMLHETGYYYPTEAEQFVGFSYRRFPRSVADYGR